MIVLASSGDSFLKLIVTLVCFVVVLFLTYITTKWIAGYQSNQLCQKNLKVVETMKLTTNKYLQIIQVGKDTFYVIGVGKDEITLIGEVSEDQLKDISQGNISNGIKKENFSEVFNKMKMHTIQRSEENEKNEKNN